MKRARSSFWQFIKFCLVGVINTFTSMFVEWGLLTLNNRYGFISPGVESAVDQSVDRFSHLSRYTDSLIFGIPAFLISVFVSFLLNSRFVFRYDASREHRVWWKVLLKSYACYSVTGLFLATLLKVMWFEWIILENYVGFAVEWLSRIGITMTATDLAKYVVTLLNLMVTIPLNFLLNKYWAYRQRKKEFYTPEQEGMPKRCVTLMPDEQNKDKR
ncbi:MAG: GtrA family protein [Clostridia bacterium]|nr:GtrA family protein [Clostridia bacterium]